MVRVVSFLRSEVMQFWNAWNAYNPGRHYMRGPGPKWREKHAALSIADKRGEPPMRIDGSDRVTSTR